MLMNKFHLLFLLAFLSIAVANAQKQDFAVTRIPDSLITDADAVIRFYNHDFEIASKSKSIEKVHYAITILKRKALHYSEIVLPFDNLSKVKNIKGAIFDKNGQKIKSFDINDCKNYSYIKSSSLFSDARYMYYNPEYEGFPFTIEIRYLQKNNGLLGYPTWYPNMDFDVSVQYASFSISVPDQFKIRYAEQNLEANFTKSVGKFKWTVKNSKAIKSEPFSKPPEKLLPGVYIAPLKFSIEGWDGDLSDWATLGKWRNKLLESAQDLSEEQTSFFRTLINGKHNKKEKIETLYQYLQNNTRYLNISEGIGGWKPQNASFTDSQGIGDCKALTNYMYAILDAVGIPSIYTAIEAGENAPEIKTDFPSNQFNHVILCVPDNNDTIWLECTNQYDPMNHHSTFTDDRYVLLNKPDGGELVKTPAYKKENNRIITNAELKLNESGVGLASITNIYTGTKYDDASILLNSTDEKSKKKYLYKIINIPDFKIVNYSHEQIKNASIPSIKESITIDIHNYGAKMGSLLFIPVNLLSKITQVPPKLKQRKNEVFIRRSYIYNDTITYFLPNGFDIKYLPKEESISCDIGDYFCSTSEQNGKVIYIRKYEINKGTYPPETYEKVRQFLMDVSKADAQKMVLEKNI